jgi:hypothetical protein
MEINQKTMEEQDALRQLEQKKANVLREQKKCRVRKILAIALLTAD